MTLARKVAVIAALGAGMFGGASLLAAPAASAHPLGNFTVNRYSGLDLFPGRVQVTYVIDMAEIPTYQEGPNIDTNGDGVVSDAERQAWADRTAPTVLSSLRLEVTGRPVPLRVVSDSMRFRAGQAGLPILYFNALYEGPTPTEGGVAYRDRNYAGRIGWSEITARSEAGVTLSGSSVKTATISDELQAYPVALLSTPLHIEQATLAFHPGQPAAAGTEHITGPTTNGAPIASGSSFAGLIRWKLTPVILALSLLLAFGFGAIHALGPGHGKTITAAYLVGTGAERRQALLIGGAVSLMHTASVLGLGLVALILVRTFPADRVYPWLTLTTGLVALSLGVGLMVIRVRARRRGQDPWHGHSHPCGDPTGDVADPGHGHDHPDAHAVGVKPISGRGLLALAVAGGILPSPTALVVLTGAIAAHRVGYGLALILAFSIGLAAALMGVGVVALRARSFVANRLGWRASSWLPILSAAVIIGFGSFFAGRGLGLAFGPSTALAIGAGIGAIGAATWAIVGRGEPVPRGMPAVGEPAPRVMAAVGEPAARVMPPVGDSVPRGMPTVADPA